MKNLFKKIPNVATFAVLILLPVLFLLETDLKTDVDKMSVLKSGKNTNLAQVAGSLPSSGDTPWSQQIHHEGSPWGGLVVGRFDCTCEMPNYIVFVNDYVINSQRILKLDYQKSGFYLFYDLRPGQYGLGTFDPSAVCKIRVGNNCIDFQVDGVINKGPGFGSSGGELSF